MVWFSDNHHLTNLGYPHKKAHKKSFRIFWLGTFFGHCMYVDELKKNQKTYVAMCSYAHYFLA